MPTFLYSRNAYWLKDTGIYDIYMTPIEMWVGTGEMMSETSNRPCRGKAAQENLDRSHLINTIVNDR